MSTAITNFKETNIKLVKHDNDEIFYHQLYASLNERVIPDQEILPIIKYYMLPTGRLIPIDLEPLSPEEEEAYDEAEKLIGLD